jgi:hypothetical protein
MLASPAAAKRRDSERKGRLIAAERINRRDGGAIENFG